MAETVGDLYVKLGLDVSSLDSDLRLAEKNLNDAMKALNHEKSVVKLKTDIDITGLDRAKDKSKILELQENKLTKTIALQAQKVDILTAAYNNMVATKGRDNSLSKRYESQLLREQKAMAGLRVELSKVTAARNAKEPNRIQKTIQSIANGASMGQVVMQGADAMGLVALAKSPAGIAAAATTAIATGMYKASTAAATGGVALDKLATKLHTTTAEAGKMKTVFTLAGTDINTAVPAITRLDKAVLTAGKDGNDTTQMLDRFGVKLTDAAGNLLPMTDQLKALAKGYELAASSGQETEYATQLLGARGAELIPVLENMTDLLDQTAKMPKTGILDVQKAKELIRTERELSAAWGQLKGVMGAAFLPAVTEGVKALTASIEALVSGVKGLNQILNQPIKYDGSWAAQYYTDMKDGMAGEEDSPQSQYQKQVAEAKKQATDREKLMKGMRQLSQADIEKMPAKVYDAASGKTIDKAEMLKKQAENAKAIAKSNLEVTDELYKATHSDLENSLHEIEARANRLKEETATLKKDNGMTDAQAAARDAQIEEAAAAEKARVLQQYNDNVVSQINRVWKDELQNRLDDIDREKRAWQQKGVDEVTATRWAEKQKADARQEAALSYIKEQKEYLDIYRKSMAGAGGDREAGLAAARYNILQAQRKKLGIDKEYITAGETMDMSAILKQVKDNLVPGMEQSAWAKPSQNGSIPVVRGSQMEYDRPQNGAVNINVNVEGGNIYPNEDGLDTIGQKVAARVNEKITQVIRGTDVSYGM